MATWKKVLVSGSAIDGSTLNITGGVTMSATLPPSTDNADLVLVQAGDGHIETRLQSDIQGVTTAVFSITGSSGTADAVPFDATSGSLTFAGDILATASNAAGLTTVTLNLNDEAISGSWQGQEFISSSQVLPTLGGVVLSSSAQIASDISGSWQGQGFISSSQVLNTLGGVVLSSSAQIATEISGAIGHATSSISSLVSSASLFAISASVVGTANEVTVTGAANQGLTLGLPDDVHIQGNAEITGSLIVSQSITADTITITGLSLVDNNAAVISGSNIFGDAVSDIHQFTGSVSINGPVTASVFGDAGTIDPSDIVVQNSDGHLLKAGTALNQAISSSFNSISSSLADGVASNFSLLNSLTTTVNGLSIPNIAGLETSASNGINFAQSGVAGGTSISLLDTASFAASGTGLSIAESAGTIEYIIAPSNVVGAAADQISGSWQGQGFISSSQVLTTLGGVVLSSSAQIGSAISGSWQGQGFISGAQVQENLPANTISGSVTSTAQGQITINGNNVDITGLTNGASPTFGNLTATNLTVTGTTTTVNTTNLNVEDQFILLNSGALASDGGVSNDREDKDGGIIVDFGGGSGSAFFYDAQRAAWGVRGTNVFGGNQADYLGFNATSDENTNIEPQHIVTVVSKSADSNSAPPSAPAYGTGSVNSDVGNMHVNTGDGTIWIYS